MQKGIIRLGCVYIESVAAMKQLHVVSIFGNNISLTDSKMLVFIRDDFTCQGCGVRGDFFGVERFRKTKSLHLNLYKRFKKDNEILFTYDHIVPKADGGHKSVSNGQCLCVRCNQAKANCKRWKNRDDITISCDCHKCDPIGHKLRSAMPPIKKDRVDPYDDWRGILDQEIYHRFKKFKTSL